MGTAARVTELRAEIESARGLGRDPQRQLCEIASIEEGHNCDENAVPYTSDGALGHGWECGICGRFLQAG